ncbi:hypothetical protein HY061_03005 [Candidatus Azambacteria bacterium]|nr:hypothetical protein [Candidatus Azambacteria bacterium]
MLGVNAPKLYGGEVNISPSLSDEDFLEIWSNSPNGWSSKKICRDVFLKVLDSKTPTELADLCEKTN